MLLTGLDSRTGGAKAIQRGGNSFGARLGLESFTALPSNIEAIEAVMRFTEGTCPFVALFGPSGWGKTHLLSAVDSQLSNCAGLRVTSMSALQWARTEPRQNLDPVLILDDLQDVFSHPRARHVVRQAVDYRSRCGKRTIVALTTDLKTRKVRTALPFCGDWTLAEVGAPSVDERQLVVYQIASECHVLVGRTTARLIARHLNGNGRSIRGAIQRLRLVKRDWSAMGDVIPACGVLSPYLLGHDGWDPRDHVYEAVSRLVTSSKPPVSACQLSSYLLLHEMGLSEPEVAGFFRVSPSTAYQNCAKVRSKLDVPEVRSLIDACRIAILCGFEEA